MSNKTGIKMKYSVIEVKDIKGKLYRNTTAEELYAYDLNATLWSSSPSLNKGKAGLWVAAGSILMCTGRVILFDHLRNSAESEVLFGEEVGWIPRRFLRTAKSWKDSKIIQEVPLEPDTWNYNPNGRGC